MYPPHLAGVLAGAGGTHHPLGEHVLPVEAGRGGAGQGGEEGEGHLVQQPGLGPARHQGAPPRHHHTHTLHIMIITSSILSQAPSLEAGLVPALLQGRGEAHGRHAGGEGDGVQQLDDGVVVVDSSGVEGDYTNK